MKNISPCCCFITQYFHTPYFIGVQLVYSVGSVSKCTCFQLTALWQRSEYLTWNPNYKSRRPEAGWGSMSVSAQVVQAVCPRAHPKTLVIPLLHLHGSSEWMRHWRHANSFWQQLSPANERLSDDWGLCISEYLRRDFADWHSVRLIHTHRIVLELSYT